jgi:hypothetical protein
LHKPESTFDQVRRSYPNLKPTDAALVATAVVLSGRYALAVYDDQQFEWPKDYQSLTQALLKELALIQESGTGGGKRGSKAQTEEEASEISMRLLPSYIAGEKILQGREDLKTLFSDILQQGVEFTYAPGDVGWLWALERVNWNVLSSGEFTRRLKFKGVFADKSVGIEMGVPVPKKRGGRGPKVEELPIEEPLEELPNESGSLGSF